MNPRQAVQQPLPKIRPSVVRFRPWAPFWIRPPPIVGQRRRAIDSSEMPKVLISAEDAHTKSMSTFARNGDLQELITELFALMETRRDRLRELSWLSE